MGRLSGKIALVTGASKGIGQSIARLLGAEGASVVVNYATSREGAEQTVADIINAGGEAWLMQSDFSRPEDHRDLLRDQAETWALACARE